MPTDIPFIKNTKKLTRKEKQELKKQRLKEAEEREKQRRKLRSKEMKSKLHPMAAALFVAKSSEESNEYIKNTANVIMNEPYRLTDKWIASINKTTERWLEAMALDQPELVEGVRYPFSNLTICKKKYNEDWGNYKVTCCDENGWRYFISTSKAESFELGDKLSFTATVKSHKEGITFLSRATSLECVTPIK